MVKSGCLAMATPQQPTTAVIMDTSWMVHTLGNVSMTAHGTERLQYAAQEREVRGMISVLLQIN